LRRKGNFQLAQDFFFPFLFFWFFVVVGCIRDEERMVNRNKVQKYAHQARCSTRATLSGHGRGAANRGQWSPKRCQIHKGWVGQWGAVERSSTRVKMWEKRAPCRSVLMPIWSRRCPSGRGAPENPQGADKGGLWDEELMVEMQRDSGPRRANGQQHEACGGRRLMTLDPKPLNPSSLFFCSPEWMIGLGIFVEEQEFPIGLGICFPFLLSNFSPVFFVFCSLEWITVPGFCNNKECPDWLAMGFWFKNLSFLFLDGEGLLIVLSLSID
jgi:hypothetical protein